MSGQRISQNMISRYFKNHIIAYTFGSLNGYLFTRKFNQLAVLHNEWWRWEFLTRVLVATPKSSEIKPL